MLLANVTFNRRCASSALSTIVVRCLRSPGCRPDCRSRRAGGALRGDPGAEVGHRELLTLCELVGGERRLTNRIGRYLEGEESNMHQIHALQHRTGPYRLLDVRVLPCASDRSRFRWSVRERDGRIAKTALHSFATEAEAFRAGNAAARDIRKQG